LYNICRNAPRGYAYEFGSHKGKSSLAIALGLRQHLFTLIEPEFSDERWCSEVFDRVSGINENVQISATAAYSLDIIHAIYNPSFVFIDSGVHDDMVMEEVKMLEDKMIPQGIIAFHDYLNQFTAVERAYNYLLSTGKYEVVLIDWPAILKYVTENNLEEGNNSWHIYPDLGHPPNFVGAVRRK